MRQLLGVLLAIGAQAATGRVIVKIDRPDGTPCSATFEVRKAGQTAVVKTTTIAGGHGTVDLEAGSYDLKAIALTNKYWISKSVTVKAGETVTHVFKVSQPPENETSKTTETKSDESADKATTSTTKLKTIPGTVTASSPFTGSVVVLREVETAPVKSGKFTLNSVPNGKYRVVVYGKSGKVVVIENVNVDSSTKQITLKAR